MGDMAIGFESGRMANTLSAVAWVISKSPSIETSEDIVTELSNRVPPYRRLSEGVPSFQEPFSILSGRLSNISANCANSG